MPSPIGGRWPSRARPDEGKCLQKGGYMTLEAIRKRLEKIREDMKKLKAEEKKYMGMEKVAEDTEKLKIIQKSGPVRRSPAGTASAA